MPLYTNAPSCLEHPTEDDWVALGCTLEAVIFDGMSHFIRMDTP